MAYSLLVLPGSLLLGGLLLGACQQRTGTAAGATAKAAVWQSEAYTLYRDSVVQGRNQAHAVSATELVSNYHSPANERQSPLITFKFSLNGQDNELPPGQDNTFLALPTTAARHWKRRCSSSAGATWTSARRRPTGFWRPIRR